MNKVFYISSSLLLICIPFILWSPALLMPDIIFPLRVDSVYLQFQKDQFIKSHTGSDLLMADSIFNFNPADVGLKYSAFEVKTLDDLVLKGWYIPVDDTDAASLLVLFLCRGDRG